MAENESMYSVYMELNSLKRRLAEIEEQKAKLKMEQSVSKIDGKLAQFASLLTKMNGYQENINNKKTAISLKLAEKTITKENSLQLAHTHHEDFMNITWSKTEIDKFIQNSQNYVDKNRNLKSVLNELRNMNSEWRVKYFEQLNAYQSAKGLLDNIEHLNEFENSSDGVTKTDSDLGCYPNESSKEGENVAELLFSTSTP